MGKIPFNVSAKTARLIGRENVSNLEGALTELIKNTYDADARKCVLYYESIRNRLYIIDNGCGMSQEVIINNWMTIGNSSKKREIYTKKGRVNTGEKGIGRFALDRISEKCRMITRTETSCFEWIVNWENFEEVEMITDTYAEFNEIDTTIPEYIRDINNIELLHMLKKEFSSTGTCFVLENLRDDWNESQFKKIRNSLEKLLPPMENNLFLLYFIEDNTSMEMGKIKSNLLNEFDYKICFKLDNEGKCLIEIYRNEFYFGNLFEEIMNKAGFSSEDREYFHGVPKIIVTTLEELLPGGEEDIQLGEILGEIYFYKLSMQMKNQERYFYKEFLTKRTNFKEISGIKIYRDDFLVRPYGILGASEYDWLDLSTRMAESPAAPSHPTGSWRVQSNQVCGQIHISRLNRNLPDKSSREGIVETKEFRAFREIIRNIIALFEEDRQYVIRKLDKYKKKIAEGEKALELAKKELQQLLEEKKEKPETKQQYEAEYKEPKEEYKEQERYKNFQKAIDYQEGQIQELHDELRLLRTLATTGIVVNTYIHEIKALTTRLNTGIKETYACLVEDDDKQAAVEELEGLRSLKDQFNSWFKVTLDSVTLDKRKRKKNNINKLLVNSIEKWREVQKGKIEYRYVEDEQVNIRCFPLDFETIMNNLITNANTVFKCSSIKNPEISIRIGKNEDGYYFIKYKDNGPGICRAFKNSPEKILQHSITDKRDGNNEIIGTGMGLWIVNSIIQSYDGYVDVSENKVLENGFCIDLFFKGRDD